MYAGRIRCSHALSSSHRIVQTASSFASALPTVTLLPTSSMYPSDLTAAYCERSAFSIQADAAVPASLTAFTYSARTFPQEIPNTIVSVTMLKITVPRRMRFLPLLHLPNAEESCRITERLLLGVNPLSAMIYSSPLSEVIFPSAIRMILSAACATSS